MENTHKMIIKETRIMYEEEIHNLRKERKKDLHDLCLELGGHDFWPQQRILRECVDPELNRFVEVRECSCCGFREEREIEEEIKPTPTPEWLEKQFDIVENTVSQWSEEKQKGFKETAFSLANKMAKNDCKTLVKILEEEEQ